jgi:hypothetical protein
MDLVIFQLSELVILNQILLRTELVAQIHRFPTNDRGNVLGKFALN